MSMLDECDALVRKYLCRIIAGIIAIVLPSVGTGVGWYVSSSAELERMATMTEQRSISTAEALDALTAETRESTEMTQAALAGIQQQLAVIQYRLGTDSRVIVTAPAPEGMAEHATGKHQ